VAARDGTGTRKFSSNKEGTTMAPPGLNGEGTPSHIAPASGRTGDWAAEIAKMALERHERERQAAAEVQEAVPGHARPSLLAAAFWRARRAACTVLTIAGLLLLAVAKRAAGEAAR
jgi:hypothetical protein